MHYLATGQFYGETNQTLELDGLTITDTEYSYEFADWHYHENPHFALITRGDILEGTRKGTYECPVDTLLFHNRQEPHYNIKPKGTTRGFQLEIDEQWSRKFELNLDALPGIARITQPIIRLPFYNIYKEAKLFDDASRITIDALLIEIFAALQGLSSSRATTMPAWVKRVDEILHDNFAHPPSLQELSQELNLHWAHLSREFPRYFHCNFGEYVRKIRVEKSLVLLRNKNLSLTEIALACGFADQSHFIRCFKAFCGITPKAFRKISA
ncbi:MAG TPA: AraC family transcriptional regulator [Blastocatellia bacterium]|nr:AraC family transcriptional regulator [Blastocatellia bacterium]